MTIRARIATVAVVIAAITCACTGKTPAPTTTPGAPKHPEFPTPDIPATLRITPEVQAAQTRAWNLLQTGDAKGAERDFNSLLRTTTSFYPGETGLGFALLAQKDYKSAATHFAAALAVNDRYIPALQGQASVQLTQNDDAGAIATLQRIVAIDPKQEAARSRLDLLQFRQVQSLIDSGRKARDAGHLDDAQTSFERALTLSPTSAVIFRELSTVEMARGALDEAETHARRATQLDAGDAESFAALGAALEARGKLRDAANAYAAAVKLDPRPAWKTKADALSDKADMTAVPAEFRAIPTAQTVTRAQLAALVGIRLEGLLAKSPQHITAVATDVRGHWAEPWILPVTQAGVMDVFPNHTFQPSGTVLRSDLAKVMSQLLAIVGIDHQADLAKWKAARPTFPDLPPSNVYYPAAALAVSAGTMAAAEGQRFAPRIPATGADVTAAVARLQQLFGQKQP